MNWIKFKDRRPEPGQIVLVASIPAEVSKVYYAIYSDDDEFDVHRPQGVGDNYREAWFKFSSRTFPYWTLLPTH